MPLRPSRIGRAAVVTAAVTPGPSPVAKAAVVGAALATGEGPGVTAAVMTAALPTRDGLSGMSGSFGREGLVRLDGGDDGLDGDPAVGDELAAGVADRGPEPSSP